MAKYRKRKVEDSVETASVADPILVVPEDEIASVIDGIFIRRREVLTDVERRRRVDARRKVMGLKPVKLFIPEEMVSLIHERMTKDGYNKGTPYQTAKSVQAEDISEFLTEVFRQYQATRPDPVFNLRCHLHKLQQMAVQLSGEGSPDKGIAVLFNHFGYVKPSYLTDKTVAEEDDETFSDRLAVDPASYDPKWTAQDVALLLDEKKVEAILRMVKPEDDIAPSTIKRTKRSK